VLKLAVDATVQITLSTGRAIKAAGTDLLLADRGWTRVTQLSAGARVATARSLPEPLTPVEWDDDRVALLGQLIGDGSYLNGAPMRYTTCSVANSDLVARAATSQFGAKVTRYANRGTWHQLLISGNGNRWHPVGVNKWLRDLGIFGQRSHQKAVPAAAFQLSRRQVALLLRHLWATDGCISISRGRHANAVHYSTNSPQLASDVTALLLRFGIVARIARATKPGYRPGYLVHVSGVTDQRRFLDTVGAFGPKVSAANELRMRLANVQANTNVDTLPATVFEDVRARMRKLGISARGMAALRGTAYGGNAHFGFAPSRATVLDYAERLDDTYLFAQATSDLFWDSVTSVTEAVRESAYGLSVHGSAAWLADGVLVEGSAHAGRTRHALTAA
jgi:replicative DNA helicase